MEEVKIQRRPGEKDQDSTLAKQRDAALSQIRPEHEIMVDRFLDEQSRVTPPPAWMLTTSRDGEPVRAIYFYPNAIKAVEGYHQYKDWGFAKNYLTITLYGPGGLIEQKVLHRPQGGDCTFVREDYVKAAKIMLKHKNRIENEVYQQLVKDMAGLFSRDNIRFDVSRFFKETECEEVFE